MKKSSRRNVFTKTGAQILFLIFCASCLEPFNFSAETLYGVVVVAGQVSNLVDRNIVNVGLTKNTLQAPTPYAGALVQAIDESGDVITYTERVKIGVYFGDKAGIPGHTYHLRVQLTDGKVYESASDRMPLAAGSISASHAFSTSKVVDAEGTARNVASIQLYGDSRLPASDSANYFRWSTEEVWVLLPTDFPDPFGNVPPNCYITRAADAQRITLYNGDEVSARVINGQLLLTRQIDQSFYARHALTVYQSAISRETHEYWRKANILANQVGSIFDSPPAELKGNITRTTDPDELVLGYFQATNQTFSRVFTVSGDLPIVLPKYCDYDENHQFWGDYPPECIDCISVNGSSFDRPAWF
jgi:hypothetical protein